MALRRVGRDARVAAAWLVLLMLVPTGDARGQENRPPPPPGPGGPPPHRRGPPPLEHVLERNAERLGLEPEVEEEIRSIASASRAEGERIREALDEAHRDMRGLLSADDPNESAVMQQAERIGALETEAQKSRLRRMLRIRALLSPEQRALLVQIHEDRRARRGDSRGRPKRRDDGPGRRSP